MTRDRSDELHLWQPILDQVVSGRRDPQACPYCGHSPLEIEADEFEVRVRCPECSEGFYGMLA